jgi:hypothetical protein
VRLIVREGAALPGGVAGRRTFHLDDFGPEVSHHFGTKWSGYHLGQFDDLEIAQGTVGHGTPP